jgi:APA family basic amino acid/polyamine antiporter
VAVAFAQYVARLAGLDPAMAVPLAVAMLLGLSAFHALGIKPGAILINLVTFGKTLAVVLLIAAALLLTRQSGIRFDPLIPPSLRGFGLVSAFFAGLVPVMFAYGGWQNLNYVAEEVQDPLRNLPRSILIGVVCVIAVYLAANVAYVHVLSAPGLAATTTPAAEVASKLAGDTGARLISLLIVVSTFGFMNLALMAPPRVYYAMAADGVFFKQIGRVGKRFRTPAAAILLQGALASALALTNTYERLLGYVVFADWIFFALAGLALIAFRRQLPGAPRPYPAPGYPWVPLLFVAAGIGIVLNSFVADPGNALTSSGIMLAGVPVYFLWKRARRAA